MSIKRLTDKRVAELFGTSDRNLQQTYKNPKPTSTKKEFTKIELEEKSQQYEIIRLGSTCLEHEINEDQLLNAINFIKSVKK